MKTLWLNFGLSWCAAGLSVIAVAQEDAGPGEAGDAGEFESPPFLPVEDVLAAALREGPYHKVGSPVATFGYANTFQVESSFGNERVQGNDLLRIRVREIHALAALSEIVLSPVYEGLRERALDGPLRTARYLVEQPLDTVPGIPQGAWQALLRQRRTAGAPQESALDFERFAAMKRQLAYDLGVDPYSSNRRLQRELNRVSWVATVDPAGLKEVIKAVPGKIAALIRRGATGDAEVDEELRRQNPVDLRAGNRERLERMGVDPLVAEDLVSHPLYTPRQVTSLVHALGRLQVAEGRQRFVELAIGGNSSGEVDALYFLGTAELMAAYDKRQARIVKIFDIDGLPACIVSNGSLMIPLYWDHGAWTGEGAPLVDLVAAYPLEGRAVPAREVYMSGFLTRRARAEAEARGLRVVEGAFSVLRDGEAAAR